MGEFYKMLVKIYFFFKIWIFFRKNYLGDELVRREG